MNRLIAVARREHRARRLCHRASRRPPPPARSCRPRPRRRSAAGSQAGIRHLRLRHGRAWTRASAGRQFLRVRQRHLGEEHADPGRQVELRHVHRARRPVAASAPARSSRSRRRTRTAGSAPPTPASWTRPRSRRRASRRSSPGSTRSAGSSRKPELAELYARADRSASARRSACFVGQDDKTPDQYVTARVAGRPRHARPRLLSVERSQARRDQGEISPASDQRADARRRAECRRAGQGDRRFRDQDRRGHWTRVESRDATKTYNKMTLAELAKSAPGFDFAGPAQGDGHRTSMT